MDFDKYETDILAKIDAGEKLEECDIRDLVFGYEIDKIEHGSGRWTTTVETIIELCGRNFSIVWERGLTEYQENEFYKQPVEVRKNTYVKPVVVTEWIPVGKD